jgi:hypothetical protein
MKKNISLLAIASVVLMFLMVVSTSAKQVIAQPSSNATGSKAPDAIEKMLAQTPPPKMAGPGATPNNYSAYLLICKAPPITNAEKDCDPVIRLH